MNAIWSVAQSDEVRYAPLQGEQEVDVAIVGGGITGLVSAIKLATAGKRVAVLEAGRIGAGSTGRSTGNLYATVSLGLSNISKKHGSDTAQSVASCRQQAVQFIERTVHDYGIECEFVRRPMYHSVHKENAHYVQQLEEELNASVAAGLAVTSVSEVPELPFAQHKAFRLEDQAQFNPWRYTVGLAKAVRERNGLIYENSKVMEIDAGNGTLVTLAGKVKAQDIVFATHTPKGINLLQAEMQPYQEYGISAELKHGATYPMGAFWILDDSKSIRSYEYDGKRYLIIIGGKHKTGHGSLGAGYFNMLEEYAKTYFDVARFVHRWSAQQYEPADALPYIGRSAHSNVYVGTGYAADGLTWGTAAGEIISGQILGQAGSDIGERLNPRRFTPIKSGKNWIKENVSVARHLMKAHFASTEKHDLEQIKPGEGAVVTVDGEKLAVYRDTNQELAAVSAECPHMKCQVHWNGAEKTWDCPCHGSRFTTQGKLIEGPAYRDLTLHPLEMKV